MRRRFYIFNILLIINIHTIFRYYLSNIINNVLCKIVCLYPIRLIKPASHNDHKFCQNLNGHVAVIIYIV